MIGGMAGDIIGSPYEGRAAPLNGFLLFPSGATYTDDTVCLAAVAQAIMDDVSFADSLRAMVRRYPDAGYGARFKEWALSDTGRAPRSNGNGAAMRVAPVGWAAESEGEALSVAAESARPSHDDQGAIRGARAIALSIFHARHGAEPEAIRRRLAETLGVVIPMQPQAFTGIDLTADGTVPQALACAFAASDWEDAARRAVALGGDTDTVCSMAGAVGEALHGVPDQIAQEAMRRLPPDIAHIVDRFQAWTLRRWGPLGGLWATLAGRQS